MSVVKKITAWSYSRWSDYVLCPAKAKYKHVDKLKEPGSAAMDRGSDIHKLAENYIRTAIRCLPKELKNFGETIKQLRKLKAVVEEDWAFDKDWKVVDWFAPTAWCRIKIDVYLVANSRMRVVDWKTGKLNPDHMEQLGLYALGAFKRMPELTAVDVELCYLDQPIVVGVNPVVRTFEKAEEKGLEKEWAKRTKPMLADTRFAPRPNDKCRWCWFRKGNSQYPGGAGPCKF